MGFFNKQKELKIGDRARDFELLSHLGGKVRLSDYKGKKNVVIAFYPRDWTPVCTNQIPSYEQELQRFERLDTQVLAISVDSVYCHQAWQKTLGGIMYPLLSDSEPHGEVSRKYGVLTESDFADRVVFVVDKKGIIRHIDHVGAPNLPNNEGLFRVLENL